MSRPVYDRRDAQAGKHYDMEKELDGIHINTRTKRAYLRAVAATVCEAAEIPQVRLTFKRLRENDLGDCMHGHVRLNTRTTCSGVNIMILLHELSHAICEEYFDEAQSHGPEFAAIYRSLLDTYKILPAKCFNMIARKHRVKVQGIMYDFGEPPSKSATLK